MNFLPLIAEANFDSVMNNGLSLSEKAFQSGQMLLMGMGTVFAVLFAIWLALTVFRLIIHDIPEKRRAKALAAEKANSIIDNMPTVEETLVEETDDMSVTVAVITAAIQAYMDSQGMGDVPFKVVSFKRKGSSVPWNRGNII